jgi:hypothetical protein
MSIVTVTTIVRGTTTTTASTRLATRDGRTTTETTIRGTVTTTTTAAITMATTEMTTVTAMRDTLRGLIASPTLQEGAIATMTTTEQRCGGRQARIETEAETSGGEVGHRGLPAHTATAGVPSGTTEGVGGDRHRRVSATTTSMTPAAGRLLQVPLARRRSTAVAHDVSLLEHQRCQSSRYDVHTHHVARTRR